MITTFTYRLQTQFGEDRCTQFRVIVVTDPQTNKQTNPQTNNYTNTHTHTHTERERERERTDLQYTAPLSLARSVNDGF